VAEINYAAYETKYSEEKLFWKLKKFAVKAGKKLVYVVFLLYYTLQKENVPLRAKAIIIGALGYFISPLDVIPDFVPIIGYTDDFGALMMALAIVSIYIDREVKSKAKHKLESLFGQISDNEIEEVNSKL
jgi:uncharacterized membrane protein YkvA (DUF1232 family)